MKKLKLSLDDLRLESFEAANSQGVDEVRAMTGTTLPMCTDVYCSGGCNTFAECNSLGWEVCTYSYTACGTCTNCAPASTSPVACNTSNAQTCWCSASRARGGVDPIQVRCNAARSRRSV
jgi:hypothetical protein